MQSRFILFLLVSLMMLTLVFAREQLEQIESPVEYDSKLTDPFFEVDRWSAPWWIIEQDDGSFEDTTGTITKRKDIPRLRHTAECRTEHQLPHVIRFSEARIIDNNIIEIRIHDESASTYDDLTIIIKNGRFSSHYKTRYPVIAENTGLVWNTTKQRLVLDKKTYRKGEVVRGHIDFECVQKKNDSENARQIHIEGFFKPTLQ